MCAQKLTIFDSDELSENDKEIKEKIGILYEVHYDSEKGFLTFSGNLNDLINGDGGEFYLMTGGDAKAKIRSDLSFDLWGTAVVTCIASKILKEAKDMYDAAQTNPGKSSKDVVDHVWRKVSSNPQATSDSVKKILKDCLQLKL